MIRAVVARNASTVWQVRIAGLWLECATWFEANALRRKHG